MPDGTEEISFASDLFEDIRSTIPLFTEESLAQLNRDLPPLRVSMEDFISDVLSGVAETRSAVQETLTVNVSTDMSGITAGLDAILAQLKTDAVESVEEPKTSFTNLIRIGEQVISTNLTPVLGLLDGIANGALNLSDLPTAAAISIMTNLNQAMAFIQTGQLGGIADGVRSMVESTIASASAVVDSVVDSAEGLLAGLAAVINNGIAQISALILDPIATFLQLIVAALDSLPARGAEALLKGVLTEIPGTS